MIIDLDSNSNSELGNADSYDVSPIATHSQHNLLIIQPDKKSDFKTDSKTEKEETEFEIEKFEKKKYKNYDEIVSFLKKTDDSVPFKSKSKIVIF